MKQGRHETTASALSDLMKFLRTYCYCAARRERPLLLTEPFMCDLFLSMVPLVVERRCRDKEGHFRVFEKTVQLANQPSNTFARAMAALSPSLSAL